MCLGLAHECSTSLIGVVANMTAFQAAVVSSNLTWGSSSYRYTQQIIISLFFPVTKRMWVRVPLDLANGSIAQLEECKKRI